MIVAQIKGTNGSGKTTIVKQLLALDGYGGDMLHYLPEVAGNRAVATINPNVGWAAVGQYTPDDAMGGCDRIKSVDAIKLAICYSLDYCFANQDYMFGVVFEGMMISTIKSTFYEYLLGLPHLTHCREKRDITPRFVILKTTIDGCIARIDARGTRRAKLNVEKVAGKISLVMRHARTYDQDLVRFIDVDHTPEDRMVAEFLKAVGDLEMLEYVC